MSSLGDQRLHDIVESRWCTGSRADKGEGIRNSRVFWRRGYRRELLIVGGQGLTLGKQIISGSREECAGLAAPLQSLPGALYEEECGEEAEYRVVGIWFWRTVAPPPPPRLVRGTLESFPVFNHSPHNVMGGWGEDPPPHTHTHTAKPVSLPLPTHCYKGTQCQMEEGPPHFGPQNKHCCDELHYNNVM